MHVLFVHPNFPAQFGHLAAHLVETCGWQATFVSQTPPGIVRGIRKLTARPASGATAQNHYCTRTFENAVWSAAAVYDTLKANPDVKPDLIVGHSGFGSTLFLSELYPDVPIVNLFEYYYRPHHPDSDMDFRSDLGWKTPEINYLRSRCRNAMILLDLQECTAGYCPTRFQKSCFPAEYQPKLDVVFDGIDRRVYHGHDERLRPPVAQRGPRTILGRAVPPHVRVVSYVSRGFESMRGFDMFMRTAKLIAEQHPDVIFFVVGEDRQAYGGDENHIAPSKTFKEWVLAQDGYDLSRFVFTGRVPPDDLAVLLASTDLHIYLTVPFVLSWSMLDAMSCGAVVLGSDTAPVLEMIENGKTGLLANFFSPPDIASKALQILSNPDDFRPLGRAAEALIRERYSVEAVLPRMLALFDRAIGLKGGTVPTA